VIPDYDRDGKIDDADRRRAATNETFRFWINDDKDVGDVAVDGSDVPGQSKGNCSDGVVNGRCDLLDFFPVWLDLKDILAALPPGNGVEYRLRSRGLKFVYTALTNGAAGSYLREETGHCGVRLNQNAFEAPTLPVGEARHKSGTVLSGTFLSAIRANGDRGVLMVEGVSIFGSLSLDIVRSANGTRIASVRLPLSISGVENMYRWINLRPSPRWVTRRSEPVNNPDVSGGKQLVFIHGFNVDENAARGCVSEVFKRLSSSGSKSMFTGVTWQGDETPGLLPAAAYYHADVINAFQVASNFKNEVSSLPGQLYVMAHSLGNMVVSSAIKDYKLNPANYFMIDAAVAMQAYNGAMENVSEMVPPSWLAYATRLRASDWHKLFLNNPTDNRNKLSWRARFGNISQAYNYYSSGEDVLNNNDPVETLYLPHTEKAWVYQEQIKGGFLPALLWDIQSHGGWGFNHFWDVDDAEGRPTTRSAGQAAVLTDGQIRTNSFFKPFYRNDIYGDGGSAVAADIQVRIKILAEAIPATSRAAGRNAIPLFGSGNTDMMTFKVNGWPQARITDDDLIGRWFHSDFKDVTYLHVYKLYDDITEKGGLR